MILPKFLAVRAYLESSGIAFAEEEYVNALFEKLLKDHEITAEEGRETLDHKTDTATSLFRLFEHIGIISKRTTEEKVTYYSFSSIGKELLKNQKGKKGFIQPLTPFFLTWLPFKIFLKFLEENPNSTTDEINEQLGRQVEKHTMEYAQIFPLKNVNKEKGVAKPFNKFVIPNSLAKIGEYLELVAFDQRDGPFTLTPLGKFVSNSIDYRNFTFSLLEDTIDYNKLALSDFLKQKPSSMVLLGKQGVLDNLKIFLQDYYDKITFDFRTSEFNAILTKDNAFWSLTNNLMGLSYDPLKVLELNANVVNCL